MKRLVPLVLAGVLLAIVGCQGGSDEPGKTPGPELLPLPVPDLERMDPAAREAIREQRDALAKLAEQDTPAERLASEYAELGRTYYAWELQDAAEVCFLNANRLGGGDFSVLYFLGLIHLEHGRREDAARELGSAVELDGDYPPARLRLGEVLIETGESERGRVQLERLLDDPTYAAAAHNALGKLAAREGDHLAAVEHFETVLEIQPSATRVHYPLGLAYRNMGDRERAAHHIAATGEQEVTFPDPMMVELAGLASGTAAFMNSAGHAFFRGLFAEAASEYRKALAADPENVEGHKGLALSLERLGDGDGAEEHFREALRLRPDDPAAHRALGLLLLRDGSTKDALTYLRRATELDPRSADANSALAGALQQEGRLDEALATFETVLELAPQHREGLLGRVSVLQSLGRGEQAIAELRSALEIDPGHDDARLDLGAALVAAGRLDEGTVVLNELLAREPEPATRGRALFNLGVIDSVRGDPAAALERYVKALESNPDLPEARLFYAAGQARNGRYVEAAENFSLVVEARPDDLRARLGEVTALVLAGRYRRAIERLEQGLARQDGEPQLSLALAKLLATCPDPDLRDGPRALMLAERLHAERPAPEHTEVLAIAHAETGEFDRAVELQRSLVAFAEEMGDPKLLSHFREDLSRYERGEPARAPWPER